MKKKIKVFYSGKRIDPLLSRRLLFLFFLLTIEFNATFNDFWIK